MKSWNVILKEKFFIQILGFKSLENSEKENFYLQLNNQINKMSTNKILMKLLSASFHNDFSFSKSFSLMYDETKVLNERAQ